MLRAHFAPTPSNMLKSFLIHHLIRQRATFFCLMGLLCCCMGLAGCASSGGGTKEQLKEQLLTDQNIETGTNWISDWLGKLWGRNSARNQPFTLQISTTPSLNARADGRALALLVRVYHIKSKEAFLARTYHDLSQGDGKLEGAGIIDMKELVLRPGQTHRSAEMLQANAPYIGIVALYQQPAGDHWRIVLDRATIKANKQVVKLVAGTCALMHEKDAGANQQPRCAAANAR